MTDTLVNAIYPISYFSLPGVDEIKYPDTFWWSSRSRYSSVDATGFNYLSVSNGGVRTSEILEIDLGRTRAVNYINMDVLRAPFDITIEYDALSTPEREAVWVPVQRIAGLPFDGSSYFDANIRSAWLNADFNFTDTKGNLIHTRYLRITFTRRDEAWPTDTAPPFQWPVFVKHLRIARYIATLSDTAGALIGSQTPDTPTAVTLPVQTGLQTREARQQFIIPAGAVRAGETPNLLGFGVLINSESEIDESNGEVQIGWGVYDVTDQSQPVLLRSGVESGVITSGESWIDFYLPTENILPGDLTKIYELRVSSLNANACSTVYTNMPNNLSQAAIPGTLTFTNNSTAVMTTSDTTGVVMVGSYIIRNDIPDQVYTVTAVTSTQITVNVPFSGTNGSGITGSAVYPYTYYDPINEGYFMVGNEYLVMRVWADIADEGRDVLGNAYRYVTRRQQAEYVLDAAKAGWMSDPTPTPDAVEALYFDVRTTDEENKPALSLVDAIRIAPRTPGVRMNVYYSQEGLNGDRPVTTNDWDYLLWIPVQQTYTLRRDEVIQLPQPIRAAFIKLEFTALNPLPYSLPTFPPLPPKLYRRFPTWIEDQFNNAQIRATIDDWFLRNATPVEVNVLQSLSDPVQEFAYKEREFLGALALGQISTDQIVNNGIVDIADRAIIDPTTASKIYISTSGDFQNTLLLSVDPTSVLGQAVIGRYDPSVLTDPVEGVPASLVSGDVPLVSTTNNRITESYQNLAQIPMRFNTTCRHVYTQEQAEFNKKAYFVGIEKVEFLRDDYTQVHDDSLIVDILHDDVMLLFNTFSRDSGTSIPDGATIYLTYAVVGGGTVTDEAVTLNGFAAQPLSATGQPYSVFAFGEPNKGGIQYFQNDDFQLSIGVDEYGQRTTYIERTDLSNYMGVPLQPIIYIDAGTVISRGVIPSQPTDDAAVVTSVAVISGVDGPFVPDYGAGTYGGGTYGDLTKTVDDAATVVAVGVESGGNFQDITDSATAVSVAVVSGTDTFV